MITSLVKWRCKVYDTSKEIRTTCNENFLTIISGFRKTGNLSEEDKAYNNALGDVYDFIIENRKDSLHSHTVSCGKWVRD